MRRSRIDLVRFERTQIKTFRMDWKKQRPFYKSQRSYHNVYCKNAITQPPIWF